MQMRSFKKMAKEKKIKVLTFVIFLCVLNWVCEVKGADVPKLVHIIRDGSSGLEGVCIASERDGYLATDWTFPIAKNYENLPQIVTYFLPNLTSDFDCNFEQKQGCADNWKSEVWRVPEESNENYEGIFDYRWEDFKVHLITKDTEVLARRIDIPKNFNITLSIRSDHNVKILFCEGWLPEKFPCYTFSLGFNGNSVVLSNHKNETLGSYTGDENILSFDQWKSFQLTLSETGALTITDFRKNFDLINILDESPLKPIYLFMSSEMPSLWKLHQNNFLYTNISTETTFGPIINMSSTNLCLSMFTQMCQACKLSFYLEFEALRDTVLHLNGTSMNSWEQSKILVRNYTRDQLQLFVKTDGPKNGYWKIDNIRLCGSSEIKVKVLKNADSSTFNIIDHEVSCHVLSMQQWRPKPFRMKQNIGPPQITKYEFNTSIKLVWKSLQIYNEDLPFTLKYQGHHLCPDNYTLKNASLKRMKSNAVTLVKGSGITIDNLIPYTHYSISLIHPIYDIYTKRIVANTREIESITQFERPRNIHVTVTSTSVLLAHGYPSCNDLYGHILYRYTINNLNSTVSQSTTYTYKGLNPFTNYTLKIETSRSLNGLENDNTKYVTYYNFTTTPDVAPPVSYLNVFETTKNSISLRYKIPNITLGIPEFVYVTYCNGLIRNKCNVVVENITNCVQYPEMFCIRITKLIKNERYIFKLSIKNKYTHTNGKDIFTTALAKSKVPGNVSNLTYNVTDCSEIQHYCNLNVSWQHPPEQNGAITAFGIELIEAGTTKGLDDIHIIENGEYKPKYSHVIRYLPYATTYNISVRAINEDFKGNYVTVQGIIDHIGEHIDQIPKVVDVLPYSLVVQIPPLDVRIDKAFLTVIVQSLITEHIDEEMWKISNGGLCLEVAETWIAKVLEFSTLEATTFTIGDGKIEYSKLYYRNIVNKVLLPDSDYCLTYVVQNVYKNISHTKVYHWEQKTSVPFPEAHALSKGTLNVVMVLLSLIIVISITTLIIYRCRHRLYCRKVREDGEHIYEAMPFEECNDMPDMVYNVTYDKLIHN